MTEQLHLVDVQVAKPLTARQQLALDYIREHAGVTVDEIGAHLHAHRDRRPHGVDDRCEWCARDGRAVVTSKALKPLLTYRRAAGGNLYVVRGHKTPPQPVEQVSARTPHDPFAGL